MNELYIYTCHHDATCASPFPCHDRGLCLCLDPFHLVLCHDPAPQIGQANSPNESCVGAAPSGESGTGHCLQKMWRNDARTHLRARQEKTVRCCAKPPLGLQSWGCTRCLQEWQWSNVSAGLNVKRNLPVEPLPLEIEPTELEVITAKGIQPPPLFGVLREASRINQYLSTFQGFSIHLFLPSALSVVCCSFPPLAAEAFESSAAASELVPAAESCEWGLGSNLKIFFSFFTSMFCQVSQ